MPLLPRKTTKRRITCHACACTFSVSARAMSVSCPRCYHQLVIGDLIIKRDYWGPKLQTCGTLIIRRRVRVHAPLIQAGSGVQVFGQLNARVISAGPVYIGPGARWRGDCRAPQIHVADGAVIEGGRFEITTRPERVIPGRDVTSGARQPASSPKLKAFKPNHLIDFG